MSRQQFHNITNNVNVDNVVIETTNIANESFFKRRVQWRWDSSSISLKIKKINNIVTFLQTRFSSFANLTLIRRVVIESKSNIKFNSSSFKQSTNSIKNMTHEKRDRDIKFSRRENFFKYWISIKYFNIKDVNTFSHRSSFVFEKIERFDFIVSLDTLNFTFQSFFSHIVTNRKWKHDIEHDIENSNNENDFVVNVNRDFATFFARRLKVVDLFLQTFESFNQFHVA